MSLLGNPEILILDEPTFGVDPLSRKLILKILRAMKTTTIIYATQNLDEAE